MNAKVTFTEQPTFTPEFDDGSEQNKVDFRTDKTKEVMIQDVIKGQDGFSPTVDIQKVDNETTITITDVNGSHVATILDGSVSDVPIDNKTLILERGRIKVNTTNDAEKDNTLPITSAGAFVILGNLESFMSTI